MPNPVIGMVGSAALGAGTQLIGGSMQARAARDAASAQERSQLQSIEAQERMHEKSLEAQERAFGEQKAALEPWQQAGLDAMEQIRTGIDDGSFDLSRFGFTSADLADYGFTGGDLSGYGYDELIQDPGYQFRLEQSMNALDRQAARAGKMFSGDQLAGAADLAGNLASQEFGAAFGRTASERDAAFGRAVTERDSAYLRAAGERDTRYNILADIMNRGYGAATALSGVSGQFGDRLSSAYANYGNALSSAYTNIGNAQAQGAINAGNAWGNALNGVAAAGQQGIQNWITYDAIQNNPAFMNYNRLSQLGYWG